METILDTSESNNKSKESKDVKTLETLNKYNDRIDTPPLNETVTEWLYEGLTKYEGTTALCFDNSELSYEQLDKLSNRVANFLIKNGINKGDSVGICLDRSFEMIICLIGILKSGAAYVPLDPNYPKDRLEIMVEDASLNAFLVHEKFSDRFDSNIHNTFKWENLKEELNQLPETPPSVQINGEDLAYIIFTSGSTGRPKGITMPHRALSNLIEWQLERNYFEKGSRVVQYSSISFDVSFQEIATTLASGGALFFIKDKDRRDPRILLDLINKFKIERLFIPFVALRSLVEVANFTNRYPSSLKEVITAGEQLRVDSGLRDFFSKLPGAILENQYGPSETHVISSYLLDENTKNWSDLPPIGKPIKNTGIYILDENMQPVQEGETGELYLAGRNLAHGYIGREDLTKKSFIENPFNFSSRPTLYKTGDLGLYNENGDIEFLGRADHQIKIRGHRIEPGEINSIGAEFRGVAQCLTHAEYDQNGNSQLITYYVSKEGSDVNTDDFKSHLIDTLPKYMVPAFIMELDEIPYTPSGKVDFKSLPRPDQLINKEENTDELTYQSETEAELAVILSELLGFNNIPRSANFFDMGGDSLKAVTLFMKIEKQFGKSLPLSALTQAPSIEELSKIIDGSSKENNFSRFRALQVIQRGNSDKIPLFLVHGGAGNILIFKDLARSLSMDQPVFAFQWPGWDGKRGEDDIMEMAKSYKDELREAWPSGPYRLGGHCIGGIIAIEIAELLKKEGAEVLDPLLVTDAPNLHSKYYFESEPESSEKNLKAFTRFCGDLRSRIPIEKIDTVNEPSKKVKSSNSRKESKPINSFTKLIKTPPIYSKLVKIYLRLNRIYQKMNIWFRLKLSMQVPVQNRHLYCTSIQRKAIRKHTKTIYNGDVLYLKSEVVYGREMGLQGWWDDIFLGFKELSSGEFDGYVIGGNHNEVLDDKLAQKIVNDKMFSKKKIKSSVQY